MPDFVKTYKCDPSLPYYGFQSWNDFFARKLKSPDVRPVASPKDPSVISSPCEAHPWVLDRNPKLRDQFWIKAQPYSLQHLLNDDPATEKYVWRHHLSRHYLFYQLPSLARSSRRYNNQGLYQGRRVLCKRALNGLRSNGWYKLHTLSQQRQHPSHRLHRYRQSKKLAQSPSSP